MTSKHLPSATINIELLFSKTGKIEERTDLGEKIKGLDLDTLSLARLLDSQQRCLKGIGCKYLEFGRQLRAEVTILSLQHRDGIKPPET